MSSAPCSPLLSFSIDEKPSPGWSPDFAREPAWQKITNRVEGTKLAAEKLGIS